MSEEVALADANIREIQRLRGLLAASQERERIAAEAYNQQQSSYRELEGLYQAAIEDKQKAEQESAALYTTFHTALTTIGGRLYTQGTGAKWQMDLLSFCRDERARLEKEYDNAR